MTTLRVYHEHGKTLVTGHLADVLIERRGFSSGKAALKFIDAHISTGATVHESYQPTVDAMRETLRR